MKTRVLKYIVRKHIDHFNNTLEETKIYIIYISLKIKKAEFVFKIILGILNNTIYRVTFLSLHILVKMAKNKHK